LSYGRFLKTPK